jgi:cob(I)alamin adenosyltransferase
MIVVFTGNGKGKTTASLGAAVRAVGRGQRVLMVQFIKGPWASGEDEVQIANSKGQIAKSGKKGSFELKKMGLGFVGILGDKLPFEDHAKSAREALAFFGSVIENWKSKIENSVYDMLIMDEVNVAVSLKLITAQDVLKLLENVPDDKIVILTGRGAPQEFIDRADLATEMKEIKHPYNEGKLGKINVEF